MSYSSQNAGAGSSSEWCNRKPGKCSASWQNRTAADEGWEEVIGWTDYYPDPSSEPFAADMVPADLKVGERALLEDLIEDIVGGRCKQGMPFASLHAKRYGPETTPTSSAILIWISF